MSWAEFDKYIREAYHIEDESTVIMVPFANIVGLTDGELIYQNSSGETIKIDLDQCYMNFYLAQGVTPEPDATRPKGIGGRCFPYFEFFTLPHHTRFYIPLKQTTWTRFLHKIRLDPYRKQYAEFRAFQKKLNALGYTALDLS